MGGAYCDGMTPETAAVTSAPVWTANRRLTAATTLWAVVIVGLLDWLSWRLPALKIDETPDVLPRAELWAQVRIFNSLTVLFGVLLVLGPAGLAGAAAAARLRRWAASYLLLTVLLTPVAAAALWVGFAG